MLDQEKNKGEFHPYLGNKNVRWGSFDLDGLAEMRFEEGEHERYGLRYGDLVVCEGGEPGRCAIWRDQVPGMKIQKALHRIRPTPELNNQYLYYWFSWAGRVGLLEPYFTGTTIKHLTGRALNLLELPLPPLEDQKYIAHILGTLDDKIELNRQINTTLESMAQALFKSWFVDFDPVIDNALVAGNDIPDALQAKAAKRKALGAKRKPLPDGLQQQFPDRFVFTEEMGWVPEGWEVVNLSDATSKISKGTTPRKSDVPELVEAGVPFIKVRDISDDGQINFSGLDEIPRSVNDGPLKRSILQQGDILFSIAGTIGRCAIVPCGLDGANINQAVAFLRPTSNLWTRYIQQFLKSERTQGLVHSRIVQAVQANFSLTELGALKMLSPENSILLSWAKIATPLFNRADMVQEENRRLVCLRDTLLPKLLSGELRIPEAEKQLAEAL